MKNVEVADREKARHLIMDSINKEKKVPHRLQRSKIILGVPYLRQSELCIVCEALPCVLLLWMLGVVIEISDEIERDGSGTIGVRLKGRGVSQK